MPITEDLYRSYLASLLGGNDSSCKDVILSLISDETPLLRIYEDVITRSLYEVGYLWENNCISVASEHIATAITETCLSLLCQDLFRQPRINRTAMVACVASEYHQLGARIVADNMTNWGWDTLFLGAGSPAKDILAGLEQHRPETLILSMTIRSRIVELYDLLALIRHRMPSVHVLVGGQGLDAALWEKNNDFTSTHYLPTVPSLYNHLHQRPA